MNGPMAVAIIELGEVSDPRLSVLRVRSATMVDVAIEFIPKVIVRKRIGSRRMLFLEIGQLMARPAGAPV